jgi:hypothetical protein
MQTIAAHVGMPSTTIPPPPPPPPPTYGVSAFPNPSHNNVCMLPQIHLVTELEVDSTHYIVQVATFGSTIGDESPEETLWRIAQGQFGGRVNGTASGGGTYSPPLNDDFNPFE